jgi:hypothetical protein
MFKFPVWPNWFGGCWGGCIGAWCFLANEVLIIVGCLVVHYVELQFEATCRKVCIYKFVCLQELLFSLVLDWDLLHKIFIVDVWMTTYVLPLLDVMGKQPN